MTNMLLGMHAGEGRAVRLTCSRQLHFVKKAAVSGQTNITTMCHQSISLWCMYCCSLVTCAVSQILLLSITGTSKDEVLNEY